MLHLFATGDGVGAVPVGADRQSGSGTAATGAAKGSEGRLYRNMSRPLVFFTPALTTMPSPSMSFRYLPLEERFRLSFPPRSVAVTGFFAWRIAPRICCCRCAVDICFALFRLERVCFGAWPFASVS